MSMMGQLAALDGYDPNAGFGLTPDEMTSRITARDPGDRTTRERILDFERSPVGVAQSQYQEAPKDFWNKYDAQQAEADITPDPHMPWATGGPQQMGAIAKAQDWTPEAVHLAPDSVSGSLINAGLGAGAISRVLPPAAQFPARVGALVLGGLGTAMGPAEAGRLAAPKDPDWWHGIAANKLIKPMSEMLAERAPNQAVRERFISPEALQKGGGVLLPVPGDRAMAGEQLLGVGGQRLDVPVELQGGHGFMSNPDPHVWASEQSPISTLRDRAQALQDKYGKVLLPYTAMGEQSVDFSHHMSDTLAEMLKNAKIVKASKNPDRATAATFDDAMRAPWGEDYAATKNWPGVLDPNLREWLINQPGKVRDKFAKMMDTSPFQTGGFPNVAEARFAVTDPRLLHEPSGASGLSISRVDPSVVAPSTHRTYNTGIGGEYLGGFERSIPKEIMYPDIFDAYAQRRTKKGLPLNPSQTDYTFRMGTPPFFQEMNDRWLTGVMRHLEGKR